MKPSLRQLNASRGSADRARRHRTPVELLLVPLAVPLLIGVVTPEAALFPNHGDVLLYLQDAERVLSGRVPYRDFPVAYPPVSFVSFVLPELVWIGPLAFDTYRWLFLLQNALFAAITGFLVYSTAIRTEHRSFGLRALSRYGLLLVACVPFVAWRFDILPTMLTAVAFAAVLAGRSVIAGIALALAIGAKLYAAAFIPIIAARYLAMRQVSSLGVFAGCVVATSIVVMAPVALAAPEHALGFLAYNTARGLQIETVSAGLILVWRLLTGADVRVVHEFSAVHITSPAAETILALQPVTVGTAVFTAAALAFRAFERDLRHRGSIGIAADAASWTVGLLALMVTAKIFSAQYIVWMLPFAAFLPRPKMLLALAISGLTLLIHPMNYERLIALDPILVVILNVRNALLVALLAWIVIDLVRWHDRRLREEESPGRSPKLLARS